MTGWGTGTSNQQFSVDANNNRLGVPSGQYGVMQYDAAGNLYNDTYSGTGSRSYDAESRMVSATNSAGQQSIYTYDADGRRVRRNSYGQETWQAYGMDGELLAEYAANAAPSSPQKEYGYKNGELLVVAAGADVKWLVSDHLGTPRIIADKTGSLSGIKRHDYLPFGEELFAGTSGRTAQQGYSGGDNVRQQFTKYERDNEINLDYAQARYYSSSEGRFTRPDPLLASGKPQQPQSWNRYTYCLNNPLLLVDPSGLMWMIRDAGAGQVVWGWIEGEALPANLKAQGWKKWTGSRIVPLHNGGTIMLGDHGVATLISNGLPHFNNSSISQVRINTAAGLFDGLVPFGSTIRRWTGFSGGANTESAEYKNAKGANGVVLSGALFFLPGVGSASAAAENGGIRISEKGLSIVERHLAQFGEVPENTLMLNRLRSALTNGERLTGADANFYLHEASEATIMGRGLSQPAAHAEALQKYGVTSFDLFHPEVIQTLGPKYFNSNWFDYWKIPR
jgi:RHS repeat-associated protein